MVCRRVRHQSASPHRYRARTHLCCKGNCMLKRMRATGKPLVPKMGTFSLTPFTLSIRITKHFLLSVSRTSNDSNRIRLRLTMDIHFWGSDLKGVHTCCSSRASQGGKGRADRDAEASQGGLDQNCYCQHAWLLPLLVAAGQHNVRVTLPLATSARRTRTS